MRATFGCMKELISRFAKIIVACVVAISVAAPASAQTNAVDCERVQDSLKRDLNSLARDLILELGVAYDLGECVEQSYSRAHDHYLHLANDGDDFVMGRLGHLYLEGRGVPRDVDRARYWFRSYALSMDPDLADLLLTAYAHYFRQPVPAMMRDEISRAFDEVEHGTIEVWMRNYHDLKAGNGVAKNSRAARSWLQLAVKKEDPEALYITAQLIVAEGRAKSARIYFLMAAEKNYPQAQVELGKFYLKGIGFQEWPYKALVWFLRARTNGLDVDDLISESETQLDSLNRQLAIRDAADFDFSPK